MDITITRWRTRLYVQLPYIRVFVCRETSTLGERVLLGLLNLVCKRICTGKIYNKHKARSPYMQTRRIHCLGSWHFSICKLRVCRVCGQTWAHSARGSIQPKSLYATNHEGYVVRMYGHLCCHSLPDLHSQRTRASRIVDTTRRWRRTIQGNSVPIWSFIGRNNFSS